jgi:hypothetical protein
VAAVNETLKRCTKCRKKKARTDFSPHKAAWDGLHTRCRECCREWVNQRNEERRQELLTLLGGVCVHCGFSDARALQVDHVNGGGYAERRSNNFCGSASILLRLVKKNPERYQLLCANCNWIKRAENHEVGGGRSKCP